MRRMRLFPALLAVLLSSCSENVIQQWPDEGAAGEGIVRIALDTDMSNMTKADAEEPNLDDFRVAIYAGDTKMRLYNDSYANAKEATIKLNSKEHRLIAQHGDTLGCGFDKPYFLADKNFTVVKGINTVEAVAKLSNVKIAVKYDATISENYSDYKVVLKHNKYTNKTLTFGKGETRYGYMPGGEFTMEVWAVIDGEWKVYTTVPGTYAPNDFVTFTITTDASEGSVVINITVDNTVENKEETIEIPAYTTPQEAPSITLAGFDGTGNIHEFVEGVSEGNNATATFIARGALKNCILTINSEYLRGKGIPSEVDFTALSSDLSTQLKAAGFTWDDNMKDSRTFSWIDFSGVIANMHRVTKASEDDVVMAGFALKVVDGVDKVATSSFSIVSGSVETTLDVKDYNVWAKKIVEPVVTISQGNVSLVRLQYSLDQRNWNDFNVTPSQNAYTLTYETVPVEAGTTYHLRAVYNGNTACASDVVTVVTEAAAQLGNSGFEDYQKVEKTVSPLGSKYTRNWYLPYASGESDPWWACNSLQSMPDGHTMLTATWCKNFPSSGYTDDSHTGSKAVMMFTVNVGSSNTGYNNNTIGVASGTTYEGEIWIGSSDDSGNHAKEGHAFTSRPSKLTFYYKYEPTGGDKFFVDAWVKAADGTIIATAQETAGQGASAWTKHELQFKYSTLTKKAAEIYVRFSSCYGDGHINTDSKFKLGDEEVKAHAGSFFKVDDIELVYE